MIDVGFGIIELDLGLLLLVVGLLVLLIDVTLIILGDYFDRWEFYSDIAFTIGVATLANSFLYFSYAVLSGDYSFTYVTGFVNNDMDFFMRVSAIWSGQSGSFFFWTFIALILYGIFRMLFRNYVHETIYWRSFVIFSLQVAVLAALTLLNEPFKLETQAVVDGAGLNPLLMNIWNLIHPPIIFVGYAICLIPFVIGFAKLTILEEGRVPDFEGRKKLDNFLEFMVSLAWLVLSSGIIIGGYWAYVTLGWGGFWAWDPVETASLIPWLFITLYYHGKYFHRRSDFLANYILSMAYISTLFATYLTRSGIVSSVHAFKPDNTLEKFLSTFIPPNSFIMSSILRFIPNERTLFLFIVLIVCFLIPHYIGIRTKAIFRLPISLTRNDFRWEKHRKTASKISYLMLLLGTYLIVLGLIAPVIYDIFGYIINLSPNGFNSSIAVGQVFFNTILVIFGGVMLLTQFFCTFYPRLEIKRKFGLMIGGVVAGVLFTLSGTLYYNGTLSQIFGDNHPLITFFGNFWTSSDKANLVIPLLILGIVGLFIEFFMVAFKENKHFIRKSSQTMLHLSFLIILLGALLSSNKIITNEIDVQPGEFNITGTSLTLTVIDLDKTSPTSGMHRTVYDTEFVISRGSNVLGFGISRLGIDKVGRLDHEVTIITDLLTDIYIVTAIAYESSLSGLFQGSRLEIKIIPHINVLWAGCVFLHFAILPLTVGRFVLFKNSMSVKDEDQSREIHEVTPS
ncbi:MAG: cytochrome c biogenesis protein CcsA [Candidatus Hodarchaeales archaeon]|jgi:cytochrome c biogenesis factor